MTDKKFDDLFDPDIDLQMTTVDSSYFDTEQQLGVTASDSELGKLLLDCSEADYVMNMMIEGFVASGTDPARVRWFIKETVENLEKLSNHIKNNYEGIENEPS